MNASKKLFVTIGILIFDFKLFISVRSRPLPDATGRSQLFGDNHVEWRVIKPEQNLPTMKNRRVNEWNGPGSG